MTYKKIDYSESILTFAFTGEVNHVNIEDLHTDVVDLFSTHTPENPLKLLTDAKDEGRFTMGARRVMAKIGSYPLISKVAVINSAPLNRAILTFIAKAIKANKLKFFDDMESAREWLKE